MLDGAVPWPSELADEYRRAGYWAGESLDQALRRYAGEFAGLTAVIDADGAVTYDELDRRVDRFAAGLHGMGLRSRDRVVVQLPNRIEFVVAVFGLLRLGAIPVFAAPGHRVTDIEHFVRGTDAVGYLIPDTLGDTDYRQIARDLSERIPTVEHVVVLGEPAEFTEFGAVFADPIDLPPTDPTDVAVILVSGGTTGLAKFVARTHDDWSYSGRAVAQACEFSRDTVNLVCLPLGHNWTLTYGLMATFHAGGTLVLTDSPDPVDAFGLIAKHGVTDTGVVPGVALLWIGWAPHSDADLSSLSRIAIGGSKLAPEIAKQVEPAIGVPVQQAFGMAEGLCGFQRAGDSEDIRIHSQGRPVSPADEVRVVDDEGVDVAPGTVGHLLARGPYTIHGYYRGGVHNENSFTEDGFYRTGDLVRVLPGGDVVFEGRVKDQINRGGEKISAEEVENELLGHPSVEDVALVGIPDEVLGERSCAFIVAVSGGGAPPARADFSRYLAGRGLADFKTPDLVQVVDALPKTPIGKVDKKELRSSYSGVR